MSKDHFIVGLDIGSYYVKASAISTEDKRTIYESLVESKGSFLNNKDEKYLKDQIVKSIGILEKKINNRIKNVHLTIDLEHTKLKKSEGIIILDDEIVTEKDIIKAIDKATGQVMGPSEEIIDTVISKYLVDGVSYSDPRGIEGRALEVQLSVFLSHGDYIEKQSNLLATAGLNLVGAGLSSHGASNILLTQMDKNKGTFLIDVGASKTRISYFKDNKLKNIEIIPVGGNNITNDIAIVLEKSREESEKLKKELKDRNNAKKYSIFDDIKEDKESDDELSQSLEAKDQKVEEDLELLNEIVKARVIDLIEKINTHIKKMENNLSGKKAVIHGGGLASLSNISKIATNNMIIPTSVITSDIIDGNSIFTFQVSGLVYSLLEVLSYTIYKSGESEKNYKKELRIEDKTSGDFFSDLAKGESRDDPYTDFREVESFKNQRYENMENPLIDEMGYNNLDNNEDEMEDYEKEDYETEELTWFQKFKNKFFN